MPNETIVVLSAIVGAFVLFAVALAWAEMCTRSLHRE